MGLGNDDDRRIPPQDTIDNTVAIGKLTAISERTTKDVDRLVTHIEKILPVHEILSYLKRVLYACITVAIMFAAWITVEHFSIKQEIATLKAVRVQLDAEFSRERNFNKNQIQYLKGMIKQ